MPEEEQIMVNNLTALPLQRVFTPLSPGGPGVFHAAQAPTPAATDSFQASPGDSPPAGISLEDAAAVLDGSKRIADRTLWKYEMESFGACGAAAGPDGTIYTSDNDHNLFAIDGRTGDKLWGASLAGHLDHPPVFDTDGMLFTGDRGGLVAAFEGKSGKPRWSVRAEGQIDHAPVVGKNGKLYVGTLEGNVYSISRKTGSHKTIFHRDRVDNKSYSPPLQKALMALSTLRTMTARSMHFQEKREKKNGISLQRLIYMLLHASAGTALCT
jgi:hypothetical protein